MKRTGLVRRVLTIGILSTGLALSSSAAELLLEPHYVQIGPNAGLGQLSSSFFDVFTELSFNTPPPSFFDIFYVVDLAPNPLAPPPEIPIELVALHLTSLQPISVTYGGSNLGPIQWNVRGSGGNLAGYDAGGGDFRIGSFFDVFTELSLDGGQTWIPSSQNSNLNTYTSTPDPASTLLLVLIPACLLGLARRFPGA